MASYYGNVPSKRDRDSENIYTQWKTKVVKGETKKGVRGRYFHVAGYNFT